MELRKLFTTRAGFGLLAPGVFARDITEPTALSTFTRALQQHRAAGGSGPVP
jgi:hypothetical protein